jgi:hypothetical protein
MYAWMTGAGSSGCQRPVGAFEVDADDLGGGASGEPTRGNAIITAAAVVAVV